MDYYTLPSHESVLRAAVVLLVVGGGGAVIARRFQRGGLVARAGVLLLLLALAGQLAPPLEMWSSLPLEFWAPCGIVLGIAVIDLLLIALAERTGHPRSAV